MASHNQDTDGSKDVSEDVDSLSLSDQTPPAAASSPALAPHPLAHLVSYIMIFLNAQPAWESSREIWVHTSAETMMKDHERDKKNCRRPIPVFKALDRGAFEFVGWW